jgi:hypothetical protein
VAVDKPHTENKSQQSPTETRVNNCPQFCVELNVRHNPKQLCTSFEHASEDPSKTRCGAHDVSKLTRVREVRERLECRDGGQLIAAAGLRQAGDVGATGGKEGWGKAGSHQAGLQNLPLITGRTSGRNLFALRGSRRKRLSLEPVSDL